MKVMMILEAVDRASRVFDKVESGLGRIAKMQEQINKAKDAARGNLFDAVAATTAVVAPMIKATNAFADFEDQLADFGLVSDYTGNKLADVGKQVKLLGPKVNKSAVEMLKGLNLLVQGGLAPEKALKSIEFISKASIATKASMEDLSKLSTGLINNMKIDPGAGLTKSLNILTKQAKDGNFELKAMARHLNDIVPIYAAMGYQGQKGVAGLGAALQIIRTQTGTDEGAKTALVDFMYKLTDQKAVKAFNEAGININKIMENAKKNDTFFEAGLQAIEMYTSKKGGIDAINNLFGEKDSRTAARALLMNQIAFFESRRKGLEAGNVIEEDFLTRMGLTIEKQKALGVAMKGFWLSLGTAIGPVIVPIVEQLTQWLNTLTKIIDANPELTSGIMVALAAFSGLMAVMAALKFGALMFAGGIASLAGALRLIIIPLRLIMAFGGGVFMGIIQGVGAAVVAMGGLKGMLALVGRAFMGLGAAMLGNPIGLTIAAIAAGAALIYYNWDKLGPMFEALWSGFVTWSQNAWQATLNAAQSAWDGIKAAAQGAWDWVVNGFTSAIEGIKNLFNGFVTFFSDLGTSLMSGVKAAFEPVEKFIGGIFDRINKTYQSAKKFLGFGAGEMGAVDQAVNLGSTVEEASRAQEQIKSIPPAATSAASAANAVLAGQDFESHGVRLMETLAAGIRAGASSAVAAVAETVQKMRDYLPHSPAKIGPLSDLDKVQFSQTLAGAIDAGAPRALAAVRMMAAGMAAGIPTGQMAYADAPAVIQSGVGAGRAAAASTPSAGESGGAAPVTVNFTVNLTGGGNAEDFKSQIEAVLPALGHQIAQIVERETARANRLKY